jgi:hypothetical protein
MRLLGGLATLALLHLSACSCGDDDAAIDAAPNPDAMETPDAEPADAMPDPPPGPVTDLTATPDGADVDLTWTNPTDADFAGVIIVRRLAEPTTGAPIDGTAYAVDDELTAGDTVVYAGTDTAFTDEAPPPGVMQYSAFAMDGATQWSSPPARAFALVAAAPQTATLTVDLTPAGVVVSQQPVNHVLAATVVYDDPGDTITVTLTATNGLARNVFAPKAVVTAADQGTITGDGDLGGDPFVRLGTGLAPAGMGEGDLVFTGIDGTVDPITIDLTIVDSPVGVVFGRYDTTSAYELIDTSTLASFATPDCDDLRFSGPTDANQFAYCPYRPGALSADGRRLYVGHRSLPVVRAVDPATGSVVMTLSLDAGVGTVRWVSLAPAGDVLYASVTLGGHTYISDLKGTIGATEDHLVVAIDPVTMTEIARVVIGDDVTTADVRLGPPSVSPDGSQLAVAERNYTTAPVHIIDTASMTLVDTDTVTAGVQPVDVSATIPSGLKSAVFTADGTAIVVQGTESSVLAQVAVADFAVTTINLPGAIAGGGSSEESGEIVALEGDTVVATYRADSGAGTPSSFAVVDGTVATGGADLVDGKAAGVHADQLYVTSGGSELHIYDLPGLAEVGTGTSLAIIPAHGLLFTPF